MRGARTTIGLTILVALAVASPAGASPFRVKGLKAISGATPFPDKCGVPEEFQAGSEGEPHLAVNPRDPSNIIVGHQQDRRVGGGGSLLNVLRVTTDGGRNWRQVVPPGVSRCAGGDAPRESDPWVAFDMDGTAYFGQDAIYPRQVLPFDTAITISTSENGGLSWSQPTFVAPIPMEGEPRSNDRPSITTDPTRPGVAYAVWQHTGWPATIAGIGYSRTTDHGRTWSPERVIYNQPASAPWGTTVSVLPDGTLVCSFLEFPLETAFPGALEPEDLRFPIRAIRSTDGGETWSNAVDIADAADDHPRDAETKVEVRDEPWPNPAVTPDGTLHLVWYSVEGDRSALLYSRSRDGGRSFSRPRKIVDGPEQHFEPSLAVAKDGTLGLTYYDNRNDRPGDKAFTLDVWFTHSHDGGATWERETHLAGPFDASTAAKATNSGGFSGRFLGEYQGLAATPQGFAAAFTVAKPTAAAGPSDILFARLESPARASRCVSKRTVTVHVRRPPRPARIRSVRVTVDGKRVAVRRRNGRFVSVISLRGQSRRTVRVRIVVRTSNHRTYTDSRTYKPCRGTEVR